MYIIHICCRLTRKWVDTHYHKISDVEFWLKGNIRRERESERERERENKHAFFLTLFYYDSTLVTLFFLLSLTLNRIAKNWNLHLIVCMMNFETYSLPEIFYPSLSRIKWLSLCLYLQLQLVFWTYMPGYFCANQTIKVSSFVT